MTMPYTCGSSADVEWGNRTIMECVQCVLDDGGTSQKYRAFAVSMAVYLKNCTLTQSVVSKTPYGAWYGRKSSLKHLGVFGWLDFVHITKEKRNKLEYRATPIIFVGWSILTTQYVVYNPLAKRHHCSRDEVFREGKRYTALNAADEAILNEPFNTDVIVEPTPTNKQYETSEPFKRQPTRDENPEGQRLEPLHDEPALMPKKK